MLDADTGIIGVTIWDLPFGNSNDAMIEIGHKLNANISWDRVSLLDIDLFENDLEGNERERYKEWDLGYKNKIYITEEIYDYVGDKKSGFIPCKRYSFRIPINSFEFKGYINISVYPNKSTFISDMPFFGMPWDFIISELRWHNEIHGRLHKEIAWKFNRIRSNYIHFFEKIGINEIIVCPKYYYLKNIEQHFNSPSKINEKYFIDDIIEYLTINDRLLFFDFEEIINISQPRYLPISFRNLIDVYQISFFDRFSKENK